MKPLVSVVVTCYNHADYVAQCLESIFYQSHQNIELLVYDDGSTDASDQVIQETLLASPFESTQFIRQINKGVVFTRNQAFELISGDFLLFVDSDNYLELNYIEAMLSTAEQEKADIVYTRLQNPETGDAIIEARDFDLGQFYIGNQIDNCSLLRVSRIGDLRYDPKLNYKNLEDYDFMWGLIVCQKAKPAPCYQTHLNYRVLDQSISARDDVRQHFENYAYILGKYFSYHPSLAQQALMTNMRRLHDLKDVMSPYRDQKVRFYFNFGEGFSEAVTQQFSFQMKDCITLTLPEGCLELRIDLSEHPVYLEQVSVTAEKTGEDLLLIYTNGEQVGQGYCFTAPDPILIYQVSHLQGETIRLVYQTYQMTHVTSPEFGLRKLLLAVDIDRQNLNLSYHQLALEHNMLKMAHDRVIHSRRWRLSTAIIRFFRREK